MRHSGSTSHHTSDPLLAPDPRKNITRLVEALASGEAVRGMAVPQTELLDVGGGFPERLERAAAGAETCLSWQIMRCCSGSTRRGTGIILRQVRRVLARRSIHC